MSDIDTGVVNSLKALDPDGRLEKCPKQRYPMKTAISRMLALVTTTALTELLAEKQKPGSEAR